MSRSRPLRSYPSSYWDTLAAEWDRVLAASQNPHQFYYREADILISGVLRRRMRVLELGCGTGGSTEIHAREVSRLVATDFSGAMVRKAARKSSIRRLDLRPDFAICDAGQLPFRDRTFEAVTARGVLLSYVQNAGSVLSEIHRVLRPGGIVALDVMNRIQSRGGKIGGMFLFQGDAPAYVEMFVRGGRQIRRIFLLPRRREFLRKAREKRRYDEHPTGLQRQATTVIRHEARLFRATEVNAMLKRRGFQDVSITPLGHLAYLLWKDDARLRRYVRGHREQISNVALALADHLRMDTALHLFAIAKKG